MQNKIIDNILKLRDKDKVYKTFYKTYFEQKKIVLPKNIDISILILCNPCNGFGDVIFATKIFNYIKEWYNIKVKIATPTPEMFYKLGSKESDIINLNALRVKQCRKFGNFHTKIDDFDLIFVAPLMADHDISYIDVKKLIPYSNPINTFFFSEYNDYLDKGFDFNTGVGNDRDGLLLTKTRTDKNLISPYNLKHFVVAYIAELDEDESDLCFLRFIKLITNKYNYKKLDIVAPKWVENISDDVIIRYTKKYDCIKLYTKNKENKVEEIIIKNYGESKVLNIRCDIFPVPNNIMLSLMKYSLPDILLTGDQSITDCLSCCVSKSIFYQIAGWKTNFAKNLAKYLPNKYLKSIRTSCGTLKALHYKSKYSEFIKEWDFRKKGKKKMDAILKTSYEMKNNNEIKDLVDIIFNSRTLESIKDKLYKLYY